MLSDGLINLKIEPEVSQLDFSHPVQVAGISVPPLIVRRASTTVELRDGQSFVIGGLLQSHGQNRAAAIALARRRAGARRAVPQRAYQKNETDLAIIVTPRLVRPARPGDVIKTPLDNSLPANDVDLFLMGKTEVAAGHQQARGRARCAPITGHMLDLPKGGRRQGGGPCPVRQILSRSRSPALLAGAPCSAGCSDIYFDRRDTDRARGRAMRWPPTRSRR